LGGKGKKGKIKGRGRGREVDGEGRLFSPFLPFIFPFPSPARKA